MEVAIFGGTFNPIHYGHLRVAEEVREETGLEKILFIPTYHTPHKFQEEIISADIRFEMVRLAIEDNPAFEVSDIEIKRKGSSYTIDTVRGLKKEDAEREINIIVGSDSFNEITTWHEYNSLFEEASFIVVARPGHPLRDIKKVVTVELAEKFWYDASMKCYKSRDGHRIRYLNTTLMDISSSDIRRRIREERSIKYLVPPVVEEYILKRSLYR